MEARFEALKGLLDELMDEIQNPVGGVFTLSLSICMVESKDSRVLATVTENGYVVVSASGQVVKCTTLHEVEQCFLSYFKVVGHRLNSSYTSHP